MRALLALGLLIFTVSCGQSNDSGGNAGSGGSGGNAGSTGTGGSGTGSSYPLSSLDEKCDATGPSGNDVLALVQSPYDVPLNYVMAADAGSDAGTSATLTLSLDYSGGVITCHPALKAPPGTGIADMPAKVDVTVHVGFSTDDGAFAETFDTPLTASAGTSTASFQQTIAAADLKGSYQPVLPGDADVGVGIGAQFEQTHTWGTVSKGGKTAGGVGETVPVGSWDNAPK
jgi:hypothetical protein